MVIILESWKFAICMADTDRKLQIVITLAPEHATRSYFPYFVCRQVGAYVLKSLSIEKPLRRDQAGPGPGAGCARGEWERAKVYLICGAERDPSGEHMLGGEMNTFGHKILSEPRKVF